MRLISRHILLALLAPFIWGVVALTGLMLMQSLPPLIDYFGGRGLPVRVMFEAILLFIPTLVALTLPMAVLVSALYGYSQLAAALEMVAMYSNGLSVWRMARPALIGAGMIAAFNFFLNDQLAPKTNARFNNLRAAAIRTSPTLALRQHVLNQLPAPQGYILKAERIDPLTSKMKDVTIYDLSVNDVRREIVADSGTMAQSPNGVDLILTLHTGTIYEFKREEPGRLQQTNFVHNRIVIRNVQTQFQAGQLRNGQNDKEMSGCELLEAADQSNSARRNNAAVVEFQTRADLRAMTGMPPLLQPAVRQPVPATRCGIYRRFGNWFKSVMVPAPLAAQQPPAQHPAQQSPTQQPPVQQPPAQQPPVQQPPIQRPDTQHPGTQHPDTQQHPDTGQLITTKKKVPLRNIVPDSAPAAITTLPVQPPTGLLVPPVAPKVDVQLLTPLNQVEALTNATADEQLSMLRSQVEFHRRIAISLAPFCFVLIGLTLALKYPSSGIGLVIGGSLVIFLGFYILLTGGTTVANAGDLNPIVAMYTPLALFTVIGLFSVASANREMGSSRSAGIFASVRNLFRRSR